MTHRHKLLALSIWVGLGQASQATDLSALSLEELLTVEIVSSASKMAQKPSETPAAVRVITARDIRRYGWRTLGEALNSLPGILVVSDRNYDFIAARGAALQGDYSIRYLITIDGTPINCALLESASVGDAFQLDVSLIERIEYVPGAGSAAYGPNAMLGTINITTRSGLGRNSTDFESGLDSLGRDTLRSTLVRTLDNGAALTVSGTALRQAGRDQAYDNVAGVRTVSDGSLSTDGVAHDLDRSLTKRLFAKYELGGFKFSMILAERSNHPSTAPHGANFDDPGVEINDHSFSLTGNYKGDLGPGLQFFGNLTYMGNQNVIQLPFYSAERYVYTQDSKAERVFAEARLITTRLSDHQIALGMDVSAETENHLIGSDSYGNIYFDSNKPDTRGGVYWQDQWSFAPDWQLHTGVRADQSKNWGSHISPRLGLTWQASSNATLKAIASRAFRNPNPIEARAGTYPPTGAPYESLANPQLQAESVDTRELIAEWRPDPNLDMSGSLYQHHLRRLIGYVSTPDLDYQYQNVNEIKAKGLELSTRYHLAQQWKVSTSLTLQRATTAHGNRAPNSPSWIYKLGADGPVLSDRLIAAWELNANGSSTQVWNGMPSRTNALWVNNWVLTANRWWPGLDAQLRVNNVFNRKNTVPGSDDTPVAQMPLYGRNLAVSVRYEF